MMDSNNHMVVHRELLAAVEVATARVATLDTTILLSLPSVAPVVLPVRRLLATCEAMAVTTRDTHPW